jgi:predicted AlkP superfamily pyrophosphatase or phosphodiesterase
MLMTIGKRFRRSALFCGLLVIGAACSIGVAAEGAVAPPARDADRVVVMISVDGLAAYSLDDPKAEMPTVRALAAMGARADSMKASTPTVTWTNHTTLVTGDTPAHHGVVGNNYFDRTTGKLVTLISDPVFDKDQIVKVPTIYDVAKTNGLRTAAIRWPASRNAKTLDWTFPDVASDALLHKYTTPALLAECEAAGIWSDGEADPIAESAARIVKDEMCVRVFNYVLHTHHPQLALLHLINVDMIEHLDGPRTPEAYAAVKTADDQVRQVWDELKQDYPNRWTLLVVSDHGFSPIEHAIMPNVVLRQAGLVEVKGTQIVHGAVHVVAQGGAAMIYILDEANRPAIVDQIRKSFDGMKGVEKVVGPEELKEYGVADPKDDPHAPDVILFADEGYNFGNTAAGALTFFEKPERKGSHGHDAALPDLHAMFVAGGVGIKPGVRLGEIQNIDVAPTIAALLGISMPGVDGKPLSAALAQ